MNSADECSNEGWCLMAVPKYIVIRRLTADLHEVVGSIDAGSDEGALQAFKSGDYQHMWSDVYKLMREHVCTKCEGTGLLRATHGYCDCSRGKALAMEAMQNGEQGI